jgi:hypothetical protein
MPAFLVAVVGLLWLAEDAGWVHASLPLGPISILIISLVLIRYAYK